ncbi:hypothetical protein MKJ01_09940 [Chryseobacterium sp. SSA4.19]|uniref:hypothetical protein n=1 Tax=Chryseobacterium sp. SSA4.19 TaxID=2919915 RepID=UPI001F4E023D|nr:hypothetical protein [Chryseobacterium sp. SSA4.19]MCJ8154078.1 hypothetical protein [Chryseobacterium sp. SSA4.19]
MNNYIKEIKAISVFIAVGLLLYSFVFILGYYDIQNYFYFSILAYILVAGIFAIASNSIKSQLLHKIINIILIPLFIILSVGTIFIPFGFLFLHVIYYVGLSLLIPFGIVEIFDYFKIVVIANEDTKLYIKFTATVFIAVILNYQLRKLIYKISIARINNSQKLKPYELDKLTDYLLSENNIRFLIYSLYVVLLFVINFYNFEDNSLTKSILNDKVILQSFVSFIAFERAVTLLKQVEFKPSDFLHKIGKSILNKYNDLDKNDDKKT